MRGAGGKGAGERVMEGLGQEDVGAGNVDDGCYLLCNTELVWFCPGLLV